MKSFKESIKVLNNYFNCIEKDKFTYCRADLLLREHIIQERIIEKKPLYKRIRLYFIYFFLTCVSLINILKVKSKKVYIAHYLIDTNNNKNSVYDFRSKEILDIIPPEDTLNLMLIKDLKYTLKGLNKKTNDIYIEAIYQVLKPILKTKKVTNTKATDKPLENAHNEMYMESYYSYKIVKYIFKFLNINKFVSLDDSRYTNEIILACNDLNIKTIGYQHARFNEYHVGLFNFKYDKYLVWNDYFRDKLLKHSDYKIDNISIVGHNRVNSTPEILQRGDTVLWVGETNMDYSEILPYVKNLVDNNYSIIYRGKPGQSRDLNFFLDENKIKKDSVDNFTDSLQQNHISTVIGTYSTTLMESLLSGIPGIAMKCSYDYASHLWEDGIVDLCDKSDKMSEIVDKVCRYDIDFIKNKVDTIWGDNYIFNKELVYKNIYN